MVPLLYVLLRFCVGASLLRERRKNYRVPWLNNLKLVAVGSCTPERIEGQLLSY